MKSDMGISRKAVLSSVMALAAFVLRAGTVYDAGEAMIEALDKGATSGVVTDCHGATWTFGSLTSADLNAIEPLPGVYRDNGFCGFTPANGSAGVPFAIVNTTNEPLIHGGETGGIALQPGEIVMHPNNPRVAQNRPYAAIKVLPPHAGIYRVDAEVRDMSTGTGYSADGVMVSVYARGAIQWSMLVSVEKSCASRSCSIGLYLPAGEPVTLIVDPQQYYDCDSTGVYFTLTEMSSGFGALVLDVNEEFLTAAIAKTLPASMACGGRTSTGEETLFTTPHTQDNIACGGFANTAKFPWVLVNTLSGISACDKSSIGDGFNLQPHEMLTHPNSDQWNASFVRVAVPSAGVYRAVGVFRDVSKGATKPYGYGVLARVEAVGKGPSESAFVSAEDNTGVQILELSRLELAAGDQILFSVSNNGGYDSDSTGMRLYLFADIPPAGNQVVNVDFDGKQPADPEPVTYAGTAKFPATGTKWNSLRGTEDEKRLIEKFRLRTANGTPTDVSVKLEASSGNLMFDNFGSAGSNNLLGDYLYVPLQTQVTLTIAGLVPDACYDLYLFTSVANSYSAAETMANFGGVEQTYQSAGPRVFVPGFSDHFVFRKVKADAFGRIVGGLSGSGTHSGVFNGFQLIGDMPERHSGLCVILR